ncbi:hypothetical protein RI129_006693 [Pyrocoelia pectoralis]|uniref:Solute carrier family 25 member 35 n=1 Tax=Pyrocoelia pectoralis TaxID=417401 RepID=A0AAN7VHR6_9COLE
MDFIIGALSASGAAIFTNPLDVLKTRMQLQGELRARGQHAVHYRNVFHAAVVVVKNDGILGLQKGLSAAVLMHGIRNCVGFTTDERGKTVFYKSFYVSALSGAIGAIFGSPLFLIKTQIQSQTAKSVAVGYQHGRTGTLSAIKEIYTDHGVRGLWRGTNASMLRALVGSSTQLTSFAMTKDLLNEYSFFHSYPTLKTFCASIVGGAFQAVTMQPFDLVSTRLYNQPVDASGRGLLYKNIPDCFRKIWKTEGFLGFYKGLTAHYMRLAPHGVLTLVFWDSLKNLQVGTSQVKA